jgi:phage shock protein PspC (stress-responsive transcriptional regulator)
MNKTVNINLAGIFFHIDEDAYSKLQRYLEAIKRSFTDSQGRSEIISDIEARIAELFTERVKHDKQVIGTKEVDEVITIMGQPEDYIVDDEIFEDEPSKTQRRTSSSKSRKLFRDTDNSYVGGVSSGLAHYFGIDALWIRLAWLLLVFGAGTGIILYILLWILIPEAVTTADKITMTGDPVNISNIEKKIRDGFQNASENVGTHLDKAGTKLKEGIGNASDSISEGVKKVDLNKQGNRIKSSSKTFFDTIADVMMFFLKLFAKFIGIILIITGASALIGLFIGFLSLGIVDSIHFPGVDWLDVANSTGIPIWGLSIIFFFFFGIMAFFILYLGLKILINNLKSIGVFAKSALLGVWLICLISIIVLVAKHSMSYKEEGAFITTEKFDNIKANDTLVLTMKGNDYFSERNRRSYGYSTGFNENGERVVYSQDIRITVKSTRDSVAKIKVLRTARGIDYDTAKNRAESISYDYALTNNVLELNNYFLIANDESYKDQEIEITVYLPNGITLFPDKSVHSYHIYRGLLSKVEEGYHYTIENDTLNCVDCPIEETEDDEFKVKVDLNGNNSKLEINDNGLEAKTENLGVKIDDNGVKAEGKNVDVKIDDDGIEITSKKGKKSDE